MQKAARGMRLSRGVIAAVLVSSGMAVSACASPSGPFSSHSYSSPPPPPGTETASQVIPAMEAAMKSASSVHVAGTLTERTGTVSVDVSLNRTSYFGTFSGGGHTVVELVAGGNAYVQITRAYLKAVGLPAADCQRMCGKYVQIVGAQVAKDKAFAGMSDLINSMISSMPPV